jgi:hypothetical protein
MLHCTKPFGLAVGPPAWRGLVRDPLLLEPLTERVTYRPPPLEPRLFVFAILHLLFGYR